MGKRSERRIGTSETSSIDSSEEVWNEKDCYHSERRRKYTSQRKQTGQVPQKGLPRWLETAQEQGALASTAGCMSGAVRKCWHIISREEQSNETHLESLDSVAIFIVLVGHPSSSAQSGL